MTKDQLEQDAITWLVDVGYTHRYGPDIAHDGPSPGGASYRQVVLSGGIDWETGERARQTPFVGQTYLAEIQVPAGSTGCRG